MDAPQGTVISIACDARRALIEVDAAVACARCAQGKGCGAGFSAGRGKKRRVDVAIPPDVHIAVGDGVRLLLEPRDVLAAAGTVYGWPLLGASAGALLAFAASLGDAAAAVSVLGGLAAAAILARKRLRQSRCLRQFTPRIMV